MPKISAATVEEHKSRTVDALLDAVDLLVAERPFESISMREIAARAGLTRTTIYNYAPDTITLLALAIRRGSAAVREAVAQHAADQKVTPSQRIVTIVRLLLLDHASTTRTFLAAEAMERTLTPERFTDAVEPFRGEIGRMVMDLVEEGVRAGEFAPVEDPAVTLALMVGVIQSAALRVLDPSAEPAAVAEITGGFLVNALRPSA
jgi:AcrR family transcriptional regulator